jgi:hypothetical protein
VKEAIKAVIEKIDHHNRELKKHEDALKALQLICEHVWQYDGHGHNDDHFTCSKCTVGKWE